MNPASFVDGLYRELLHHGIAYFFPDMHLELLGPVEPSRAVLACGDCDDGALELEWLGSRYRFGKPMGRLTSAERALLASIGRTLSLRYEIVGSGAAAAHSFHLFRGLPEDRYVSAFLEALAGAGDGVPPPGSDRVAEAVEVLRGSALNTYENRRVTMGVLLFGARPDPCHTRPPLPAGAVRYSSALTAVRSFRRLSDGLQTVALVNEDGLLVEIVDVHAWAHPFAATPLPVPCAAQYRTHGKATMCGGHQCLVLTPNGEIKVFAEGMQIFSFLDGRWRLTDPAEKYRIWSDAVGDAALAERLFTAALDLAEGRRGGLFLVLDDPNLVERIIAPDDVVRDPPLADEGVMGPKHRFHYLLRHKRVFDLAPTVLETLARIDGAIVLDRAGNLLSFGAILRFPLEVGERSTAAAEGGRSTAALAASRVGKVLKVSEDGMVSFFDGGRCVWEL